MSAASPNPSESHRGEAEALLERLYADYARMVKGLCRKLLPDPTEAEDASQQTFLSAYRSLLGGTRPEHPTSWLATIARNECWARAQARMREPLATHEVGDVGATPDAFAEVARHEDLAALTDAIGALPPSQKEAFVLRELGGLSQRELSKRLAISESALETLLFRARRRLRERLEPALQPLYGALPLSFGLRELLMRLLPVGGGPAIAKIAAATAGVAVLAAGVASEQERPQTAGRAAAAAAAVPIHLGAPESDPAPEPAAESAVIPIVLAAAAEETGEQAAVAGHATKTSGSPAKAPTPASQASEPAAAEPAEASDEATLLPDDGTSSPPGSKEDTAQEPMIEDRSAPAEESDDAGDEVGDEAGEGVSFRDSSGEDHEDHPAEDDPPEDHSFEEPSDEGSSPASDGTESGAEPESPPDEPGD